MNESADEAEKKGVKVYRGSMISDFYKDQTCPNGREFNLVSIMGEMVNFVGLETDTLLTSAIKQTKDGGYLLVSCMHSAFDDAQEGSHVIWSFTESNKDKWKLDEAKISRTFTIISKQGMEKMIDDISRSQNCHLILCNEGTINNYYGDMRLGIYIFQKKIN